MTDTQSDPVRGFFSFALITVGVLMMLLCGGCGALFFIAFLVGGLASSNHEDVSMVIMPIVLGGVPAGLGWLLFWVGRTLRKPPISTTPPAPPPL